MDKVAVLKRLGFTEYEARAYLSLSALGLSSAREICLHSKLPRNKVYESLQRLEEKNRITSLHLSPRKYKILNPETLKDEILEMSESVHNLVEEINQPKTTNFEDMFLIIKGRKNIVEKLAQEDKTCTKEIYSCSELNHRPRKNMKIVSQKIDQGVKVKFITLFDKKNISIYKEWISLGVDIRIYDKEKFGSFPRMTILDGKKARLTVGIPEVKKEEDYISFWTESIAFSNLLRNQFTYLWKNSRPIGEFITRN